MKTNMYFWLYLAQFFCKGNKTHILWPVPFFRKSCCLWYNMEKYCRVGQATDYNTVHACCMLDTYVYRHIRRMCNTYCCCTAIIVARKRLNVKLHVQCLNGEATSWTSRGSNHGRGQIFISSSKRADCFWGPQSLLLNGNRYYFPGEWGVKADGAWS